MVNKFLYSKITGRIVRSVNVLRLQSEEEDFLLESLKTDSTSPILKSARLIRRIPFGRSLYLTVRCDNQFEPAPTHWTEKPSLRSPTSDERAIRTSSTMHVDYKIREEGRKYLVERNEPHFFLFV